MDGLEQLQHEIEALRARNEKLQSAKETLQAKAKRLESANEVLATDAERLQLANEQLEADAERLESANEALVTDAKKLVAANEDLQKNAKQLSKKLSRKQDELDALIRRFFGRQSERFDDKDQLKFEFANEAELEDLRDGIEQAIEEHDKKKKAKPKRRKKEERFPENLPRKEVTIDLSDEEKKGLKRIGEDIVESAHYRRPIVYILRKIYPKYVPVDDPSRGIQQASRPPALIKGDRYGTSFAATVIANRLGYHLPIYRQEDLFAECGLHLHRSTLLNLQESAERALRPFAKYLADLVRTDDCVGSDDTSIRLLLPETIPKVTDDDPKSSRVAEVLEAAKAQGRKSILAKMWAYRGVNVPVNVFDFTVSRHRDGPDLFLVDEGYRGTLLGDCYGANTGIHMRSSGQVQHAACVSHARRKVEAALDNHQVHAKHLLGLFRLIYDVEDESRGQSASDRLELRRQRSVPLWEQLRDYLEHQMTDVLKDDKISEARSYILNQWSGLTVHLSDGGIPVDNNLTEQLMKQVALGRKNWLHLGSLGSGYRTATLMTVVSTAVRNDLDVATYLESIMDQLLAGSADYESLRADVWAKANPESIRAHRQSERAARNERQDRARLERRLARLER